MKTPEEVFNILKEKFGDAVVEFAASQPVDPYIVVNPKEVDKICQYLFDDEELSFNNLMNLSGVDDANGKAIAGQNGDKTIEGGTLSVYYHIESTKHKHKIVIKATAPRENPEVNSVESIWRHADWHEREAYDLVGIIFLNHPNLTRILMPYDWDAGYPLRKDYKNPEFYHGMKVPY
jgi:NADH-quinone oxidoreductase subunit C